ncbi:MAG: hypothetical protein E4H13_13520, partial [Calditrichales bacterium]
YTDEDILADSEISGGKIQIRDEAFDLLILPPLTHIKYRTFKKLIEFVDAGGRLIASTLVPFAFISGEGHDVQELESFFGVNPRAVADHFINKSDLALVSSESRGKGNIHVLQGPGLSKSRNRDLLDQVILSCIIPDVTIDNENVFYLHRIKDGYDIYFFVNLLQEAQGEVEITFERVGRPELWNANTGEIEPIHVYKLKEGRLSVTLDFPQTESRIVIIRDEAIGDHISASTLQIENQSDKSISGYLKSPSDPVAVEFETAGQKHQVTATLKKPLPSIGLGKKYRVITESDNVLCISKWKMKIAEASDKPEQIVGNDFDDTNWLGVTLGAWEMQLPIERDQATYPVDLWYRTSFEVEYLPKELHLLVDGFSGRSHKLFINGKEVCDPGTRSKLDAEIKTIAVSDFVRIGRNQVAIQLEANRRTDGILDLLKITGDFSLRETAEQQIIVAPRRELVIGDWTKQGYPNYSGTISYETEVDIPAAYTEGKLFLHVECGEDVLAVRLNDNAEIAVPWHPYKLDISGLVIAGNNKIVLKVTNTIINILEAVPKKSGLFEEPVIEHAHRYTLTLEV